MALLVIIGLLAIPFFMTPQQAGAWALVLLKWTLYTTLAIIAILFAFNAWAASNRGKQEEKWEAHRRQGQETLDRQRLQKFNFGKPHHMRATHIGQLPIGYR